MLLDTYPAEVAFSLRKLRTAYLGSCIRVRRSSDNAETDIGFVGGVLDFATMESFVGSANTGFVVKWYNQGSGGATYEATQGGAGNQWRVKIAGGATEVINGKFALNTLTPSATPSMTIANNATFKTMFSVYRVQTIITVNGLLNKEAAPLNFVYAAGTAGGVDGLEAYDGTQAVGLNSGESTNQTLGYLNMRGGRGYLAQNGAAEFDGGVFAASLQANELFGRNVAGLYLYGQAQEMILYNSDQSANKTVIETNINTYYAIY